MVSLKGLNPTMPPSAGCNPPGGGNSRRPFRPWYRQAGTTGWLRSAAIGDKVIRKVIRNCFFSNRAGEGKILFSLPRFSLKLQLNHHVVPVNKETGPKTGSKTPCMKKNRHDCPKLTGKRAQFSCYRLLKPLRFN